MDCHLSATIECTTLSCPFWYVDKCAFAELDLRGHDDVVCWLNTLRLRFSESGSPPADGSQPTRTLHSALASGKE
jgi:hypothetical protein